MGVSKPDRDHDPGEPVRQENGRGWYDAGH
jgi:hypothetical protein